MFRIFDKIDEIIDKNNFSKHAFVIVKGMLDDKL